MHTNADLIGRINNPEIRTMLKRLNVFSQLDFSIIRNILAQLDRLWASHYRAGNRQQREIEKLKDAVRELQATLGFDHLIDEPETPDAQALKRFDEREQFNPDVPIF